MRNGSNRLDKHDPGSHRFNRSHKAQFSGTASHGTETADPPSNDRPVTVGTRPRCPSTSPTRRTTSTARSSRQKTRLVAGQKRGVEWDPKIAPFAENINVDTRLIAKTL